MTKDEVIQLQTMLARLGYSPGKIDGVLGAGTKKAVVEFQTANKLTADGIAGPVTIAALRKASQAPIEDAPKFYVGTPNKLNSAGFALIAGRFNLDVATVRAVNEVEAAGSGFTGDNVKALYEPHIAFRRTSGATRDQLAAAGVAYPSQGAQPYPKTSYARIDQCSAIAGEEVAALSTSWGLGQIMGFNFKACGYPNAVAMVRDFAKGETQQLEGMLTFISANAAMLRALQRRDWAAFARLYNGPKYEINKYDKKLAAAYAKYS